MKKPKVIECFTDNGEHSHWALIDKDDGKLLWDEADDNKDNLLIAELQDLEGIISGLCGDKSPSVINTVVRAKVLLKNSSWNKNRNSSG